ncbi:hypothetical protein [Rhodococcus sp. UNC23MFCrub1.1]|uniref:hypothetical protein n=1 Tax=Rhodococcus sp. UNC23MFCrub1.1 TaxID=1449068 RepID=UPI0004871F62|nr:hypothetical protein [Rhodococcus sp. UNC23MFCrub1.1]
MSNTPHPTASAVAKIAGRVLAPAALVLSPVLLASPAAATIDRGHYAVAVIDPATGASVGSASIIPYREIIIRDGENGNLTFFPADSRRLGDLLYVDNRTNRNLTIALLDNGARVTVTNLPAGDTRGFTPPTP